MSEGGDRSGHGLDFQKLALCFAKLFQKQAAFAAQHAAIFAKLAAGDEATLEAVLNLPEEKCTEETNGGKKRRAAKRDPDLPKRPKSGYQLYVCEKTPTLRAEQPEAKMTELMTVLANDWKNLNEEEKEKYQKLAVKEKTLYQDKLADYKANQSGSGGGGGATNAVEGETAKPSTSAKIEKGEDEGEDHRDNTESDSESEKEMKKAKKKKHKKHKKHRDKAREEA
ncbi:hypothetical protein NSK_001588 [Nannochloropsis salina CCMP1776]|jgi:hypothetical protein|uniref:High mobility group protein b3 n=2 Tax=Monodopsidaceae TaxID=425072 RepID=W7U6C3_9STRA|nr:high mobility group protein b3 [Nannochloropsis gaditana]TFJ87256.1 hypothetical protein NSK_001588 [Nannochloropsis salina CCMP1776]|eukprot:TFJ87256.1 hypothetical protein NSK_001588 [Nannochloropsis salina CCMP1776]